MEALHRVGSRTQGDGKTWARSHIKVTLGTTAVPRWPVVS